MTCVCKPRGTASSDPCRTLKELKWVLVAFQCSLGVNHFDLVRQGSAWDRYLGRQGYFEISQHVDIKIILCNVAAVAVACHQIDSKEP